MQIVFTKYIRRMNYNKYPPNWLTEIRPYILKRDKYTCQHCGRKHKQYYINFDKEKNSQCILQVAHLDHDPENWNISMKRLLSLCQECHLKYDRESGVHNIKGHTKKKKKKKKKPLPSDVFIIYAYR